MLIQWRVSPGFFKRKAEVGDPEVPATVVTAPAGGA
jgi:hypothetical protein